MLTDAGKLKLCEKAGYDAGTKGPNTTNCHFSLFATPECTRAWERGKAKADRERAQPPKEPSGGGNG